MSTASTAFDALHPRIQHFLWNQGWSELRDIQEHSILALQDGPTDLVVAASTASGKTEAAFLPLLSQVLRQRESEPDKPEPLLVYVSPLKALINDQFSRLTLLCEQLEIAVWPWHGDVAAGTKKRFLKQPGGVLLITPESLEAFFCGHGSQVPRVFCELKALVVDELHAFIGEERGKQLQSLLHRMDCALGRPVARIGLSATLGDMSLAAAFLRPNATPAPRVLHTHSSTELLVLLKGYVEPAATAAPTPSAESGDSGLDDLVESDLDAQASGEDGEEPEDDRGVSTDPDMQTSAHIASHLFKTLRGSNNLIFPNTRNAVERYALKLRTLCAQHQVPNEFFPHHGSLSRELREEAEQALKSGQACATAVCTNTLELGIDIGAVKSVAQIGPPPSVASLRQRLGRSGRRDGEPAVLRGYCQEHALTGQSHLLTQLREELVQSVAMVQLLLAGWFEPPQTQGLHLSTLVQQLLALVSERSGVTAASAYRLLCKTGPFSNVSPAQFTELLRHLGKQELLTQDASGVLLHGHKAERLVNHHTFYAAFATQEEYRLVCAGRTLGSVPLSNALSSGDLLVFGGRTWHVISVDERTRVVDVRRTRAGKAPRFESDAAFVHARVRQEMRKVYESCDEVPFLDSTARQLLDEGRDAYRRYGLSGRLLVPFGTSMLLFTWLGDRENQALVRMLKARNVSSVAEGVALEFPSCPLDEAELSDVLEKLASDPAPTAEALLAGTDNLAQEKWDWALPDPLLHASYASLKLDIAGAHDWLQRYA